jgi:DNA-binding MarR family transcriptional regulator
MERTQLVTSARRSFTRLARFINQLMRENLSCGPITVQQCYTLEALIDGPKSVNALAAEVALHQSTLSRIVEKLEKQDFVTRTRNPKNQRSVEVQITESGRAIYQVLDAQCTEMIAGLIDLIPVHQRDNVIQAMDQLAGLLDPENNAFMQLVNNCCSGKIAAK